MCGTALALTNHNSPLHRAKVGFTEFDHRPIFNDGMANWIRIADIGECPPGRSIERVAAGRIVALFNVDGDYFALDGVCAHQGGPLAKGTLRGRLIACPWHGWQYDVTSGLHTTNRTIAQSRFAVRVERNDILIDLENDLDSLSDVPK
jgi:nitrite reductase (NADH) small subunit